MGNQNNDLIIAVILGLLIGILILFFLFVVVPQEKQGEEDFETFNCDIINKFDKGNYDIIVYPNGTCEWSSYNK